MSETKKELLARIHALQSALYFWLPCIPDERDGGPTVSPECEERISHDADLLVGLDGCPMDTAESFGWVELQDQGAAGDRHD